MHDSHPRSNDSQNPPEILLSIYVHGQRQPIFDDRLGKEVHEIKVRDRFVIGRQDVAKGEPGPFRTISFTDRRKLIITSYHQREVSRQLLEIAPDRGGAYLRVGNVGNHEVPVSPATEGRIAHKQVKTFVTQNLTQQPIRLMVGSNIALQLSTSRSNPEAEFNEPPQGMLSQSVADVTRMLSQTRASEGAPTPDSPSSDDVQRILSAVSAVLEKAANSPDFYSSAAENVCKLGNFDSCSYLGLDQMANQWQCEVTWPAPHQEAEETPRFDSKALDFIWNNRQTWSTPTSLEEHTDDHRVVVTPVLSRDSVVGALYASKKRQPISDQMLVDCEVKFVEVIRDCLAVGLERLRKEREVAKQQICLAQFFPPGIADRILNDPALLETREENISVLFCDIRGFSAISAELGALQTMKWLREVLGELSECVIRNDGVLLEYVGDELVAMWGAPDEQRNHADLACQAAVQMVGKLEALNESWADRIPAEMLPFGLTIGINTGDCVVGRKGTDFKYMWGPLGPTVNIASRVQGATKQFSPKPIDDDTPAKFTPPTILITEATRVALMYELPSRYLGSIRAINIPKPVRVHEIAANPSSNWPQLQSLYEAAYQQFTQQNFLEALNTLDLITREKEFHFDGPTKCLRDRALTLLQNPRQVASDHPVWMLDRK
ncbi:adenylate/guanylate cyclase domain-containing protein [Bremerella sp. JC817]|uniref:adenylate/guanylate cyclase domain-containing protein n=1 Tax=Bremerella sp. JC817 TaxID=3231756 RepID=UPI0034598283